MERMAHYRPRPCENMIFDAGVARQRAVARAGRRARSGRDRLHQRVDAEDIDHSLHIVGQHLQAHLGFDLFEPPSRDGRGPAAADAASLGFMLFWTRSGVEGEDHLESVVRADALLCLECRKLLGVGRKAWILSSKEHGHAPPWHDPVLKAFEGSRTRENMANPFCGP